MDILLIDPPYTTLKRTATNRGYHVGLTSLAAYLRLAGIENAVMMGDPVTSLKPTDGVIHANIKTYAAGQQSYEKIVNNENHDVWKRIGAIINQTKPRAVGISYLTPLKSVVDRVASVVKNTDRDIKVVVGSFHPTFCPDEVMKNPDIDFIVTGEGEIPLVALVNELKKNSPKWDTVPNIYYKDKTGQVKSTPKTNPISNLDELPFLARDLVLSCDYNIYRVHSIYTSRGCPYSCSFCSDRGFWGGKVRRRSVNNVIEEMKLIQKSYKKVDYVDIIDGTFTFDKTYIYSFCNSMINDKVNLKWRCTARYDNLDETMLQLMKQAGCSGLYLGAETGSDRLLNQIDKKITTKDIYRVSQMVYDSGILSATAILVGLPDETKKDAEETLKLMKNVKTDIFDVNSYVPLPGSELYASSSEEEMRNIDWLKVGYKSYGNYFSKRMSPDEFAVYRSQAYKISSNLQRKTIIRVGAKLVVARMAGVFKKLWPRPSRLSSGSSMDSSMAK